MLTRRLMLKGALGMGAWAYAAPGAAYAAGPMENRFVLVVLRGGLDGVAAVAPYGDPAYAGARGALAMPPPHRKDGVLDLDGFYGLDPALAQLHPLWLREEMLIAHAIAIPVRTRSHFDAQDMLENGTVRAYAAEDGWLNRALAAIPGEGRRLGLSVGNAMPTVLRGPHPVASWAPPRLPEPGGALFDRVSDLYEFDPILGPALAEGRRALRMSKAALENVEPAMRGSAGPSGQFRTLAAAAGHLLAAPEGARIAVIEMGGWDTHVGQASRLPRNLALFADGIVAMRDALGDAWRRTVVAAVSEFGRTVHANGSVGTDHGTGGVALLFGGALAGKRVIGEWPGLAPDRLFEGRDLAPLIDMRTLFKALLRDHLSLDGATLDRAIFPDSAGTAPPLKDRLTRV